MCSGLHTTGLAWPRTQLAPDVDVMAFPGDARQDVTQPRHALVHQPHHGLQAAAARQPFGCGAHRVRQQPMRGEHLPLTASACCTDARSVAARHATAHTRITTSQPAHAQPSGATMARSNSRQVSKVLAATDRSHLPLVITGSHAAVFRLRCSARLHIKSRTEGFENELGHRNASAVTQRAEHSDHVVDPLSLQATQSCHPH